MVNETRSGIKIKDDGGSNSSKKKSVVGKGSATLGVGISDASGLRRSPRGDTSLSKQNTGSLPCTRKSERLVKQMAVSPLSEKKTEKVKKQVAISPLRRSDRGKKHISSSSSGSKKLEMLSDLLDEKEMKGKGKGEKSLKQLAVELKEVGKSEDMKPVSVKRKKWDGHSFKALLKKQRIGKAEAVLDGDVVKASDMSDTVEGTSVDAEKLLVDCSTEDPLQIPELAGPPSKGRRVDHEPRSQDFSSCSTPLTKGSDESSIPEKKNESLTKLSAFPAGSPPGLDSRSLETLNKLQEFLHKGQSAVVFDDQDRIMKIILFIRSLNDFCQPFLIISSSDSLPLWEAELLKMAPSMNIIFYIGDSDNRRSIRKMKFYDKGGRIMFQVLLSTLDATVEDLQVFESLNWKAVVVDECQQPQVSSQFEQLKLLAEVKVLLFSGPIKDSVAEHVRLLSLLGSDDSVNADGPKPEQNDNIYKLKERLLPYIAYECKSYSSKFVEYWVPSQISNVQLEQYCSILLSNAISLRLCSKTDPVGALRDIVFSTKKCCDHPYIVDPSLKSLITKDLPAVKFLDVGIKASGKLQFLELILSEMNKRQLRVLILYQSIGGFGKDTLSQGDILDDFLRERFGPETYERIDGAAISSKLRQKALDSFNKKSGRFVFLLENRACLASIRLSAVDAIIIFDSDWDPANDVKALHKISIDSQFKQIKIFRLYSPYTLEEKVLILAKQGLPLESKLQNVSRSTSNMLLMWGASYLMNRLDEFHSSSDMNISSEPSFLNKVVEEFLALLSQNGKNSDIENPIILRAPQSGGVYCSNLKLLGELKVQLSDELSHDFWTNLLKERNPRWKFLSGKTQIQRHRKKVHYLDESPNKADAETVEAGKKRKKMVSNCIDPANLKAGCEQGVVKVVGGGAFDIPRNDAFHNLHMPGACEADTLHISKYRTIEAEDFALSDVQKSLYLLVKPDISKLCEILNFSEEAKLMVGRFLEYVIANHQILKEPASILHAFLISLCWTAASLIKQKVDRKESLNLAKCHLNFCCNEEEANCLYSVLRKLKKTFIKENIYEIDCSKGPISGVENGIKGPLSERVSQPMSSNVQNERVVLSPAPYGVLLPRNTQNDKTRQEDTLTNFKRIERKYKKRMAKFHQKQEEETKVFHTEWKRRRAALSNKYRVESAIIHEVYSHMQLRTDKIKVLNNDHAKKLEELEQQKEKEFKQLKAKQLGALNDEKMKLSRRLNSAISSANEHRAQDEPPLHGSEFESQVGYSQAKERRSRSVSEKGATLSDHLLEEQSPNGTADNRNARGIMAADTCMTTPNQAEGCNYQSDLVGSPNLENDLVEKVSPVVRSLQPDGLFSLFNISENNGSTKCHSAKQITGKIILTGPGEMVPLELPKDIAEEEIREVDSVEIVTPAVESNREYDRSGGACSDKPNRSISCDSSSVELELPTSKPAPPTACDDSLSQNMVLPHESQTPLYVDVEDEDRLVEVPSSQPVDAEQIDESDHELPLEELREQPQLQLQPQLSLSTSSLLKHNQHEQPLASGSARGTISEGITPQSVGVSFHLSEAPQELSDRAVSLPVVDAVLPPRVDNTEIPLVHNQTDLPSSSGSAHGTITEGITPAGVSCNLSELPPEPSDQAISLAVAPIDDMEKPVVHNQPDPPASGSARGTITEDVTPQSAGVSCQLSEVPPEPSDQAISLAVAPIDDMEIPVVHNQPDPPPASGSAHGTITEDVTPQSAGVSCQLSEVPLEPSDSAVSLPVENEVLLLPVIDTEMPLVHNQLDLRSASRHAHQVSGGLNSSFHNDAATPLVVRHIPELPNQVIPHVGESVELDHSRGLLRQNQHDVPSGSRLDCQPSGEALRENVVLTTELPNQVISRTGVNMSTTQGLNNLPLHVEPQVPSRIPSLPSYGDPLQNELERIRKETEQAMKIHEDMKLKLKAELEETIARARREYEVKRKDAESAYLLKKNELDVNHNKVLMNKILADAFRSKCLDIGPSRPMATQQGLPPGLTQRLNQSRLNPTPRSSPVAGSSVVGQTEASQQNTVLLSQPASRLHPISVSVSTGQPAVNLQNMAPQLQPAGTISPVFGSSSGGLPASGQQAATPLLQSASRLFSGLTVSSLTGQPAASQQNTAAQLQPATSRVSSVSVSTSAGHPAARLPSSTPPLQIVHQSAALFSSTPPRPPQINPITPSTGNHRVGNEIRAPAPHLQPFRSSSLKAVNLTSVPHIVPSHLTPTDTTSRSLPKTPAFPQATSVNYPLSVRNISAQSKAANGLSMADLLSPINPSSSCMDMLKDIHKQHSTRRSSNVQSLRDLGSKLDSLDLSVIENGVNALVNSTPAAVTPSVVCLSDDDD